MANDYPEHVREAAQAIDELRAQRRQQLPARERAVQAFISRVGRPRFRLAVVVVIIAWVVLNTILLPRHANFDTPTFGLLSTIAQLISLMLVIGILSAENTQGVLEQERARLMLQLAMIHDRKITEVLKAVEDLQGARRGAKTNEQPAELREATDIHEAASALREAESEQAEEE